MKKLMIVALAMSALAGCAVQSDSANVYNRNQTMGEQTVRMGVVESVRKVTIDKGKSGVGSLAGGALGGIAAGSTIGGGNGALAAGVLGALLGGVAGDHVDAKASHRAGLEITVKLDNGELRAITQDADEQFEPGQRVRILSGRGTTRVTH